MFEFYMQNTHWWVFVCICVCKYLHDSRHNFKNILIPPADIRVNDRINNSCKPGDMNEDGLHYVTGHHHC